MTEKLKVGVFGVGSLGQHHARIYSQLPEVTLVGVHDVNPARAAEIAERLGTRVFERAETLAEAIEAASVVVPTDKHLEVFHLLADRNVHMLMEKPIASTTQEAEQMVARARDINLILQVGHVERFNPVVQFAMQFLEDNLQEPRFIEALRISSYPPPRPEGPPRGTEVSVVLDLMIHDLDIVLQLVRSRVRELHAVGVPVLSQSEDIANVRIVFENGCIANLTASRISMEKMRKIRVFQSDTYLSLDYMKQSGQLCRKTGAGIQAEEVPIEKDEPLLAELKSFTQCVIHRNAPVVSGSHASEALKLAVEICRQMRECPS